MTNAIQKLLAGAFVLVVASAPAYAQSVEKKRFGYETRKKARDCPKVQITVGGKIVAELGIQESVILTKPIGDIGEKCSAYEGLGSSHNFGIPCSLAIVQFREDVFLAHEWVLEMLCYE